MEWILVFSALALLGFYVVIRRTPLNPRSNVALHRRFATLHAQARTELTMEQVRALTSELAEIKAIEAQMKLEGVAPDIAHRMIVEAGIKSIANHIALNRLLPG